jgi:hypothetical protein
MNDEVIEVQGPVGRPDSIRQRLGNAAWGTGATAFVANGVPFSFTTGPELAARVCDLTVFLAEARDESSVTLHDVGAGTGYLTRHVIEALAERDPKLARSCEYVASDNSQEMVSAMASVLTDLPLGLEDRVSVRVGDALSSEDILEGDPSIVLMSYLIDAVPPQHVVRSEGTANEVLVQTYVVADQPVVDGSTWPPRVLEGETLAEVLRSSPESLSPGAILQVLPLIVEAALEGPALENHDDAGSSAPFFNTRPDVVSSFTHTISQLRDESILLVTDFGFSGSQVPDTLDVLMTEYGAATCYAVFFNELIAAATSVGTTCCVLPGGEGGTHTLAIYKGSRTDAFQGMFEGTFGQADPDRERTVAQTMTEVSSLEDAQAMERDILATGQQSYANSANLAHLFAAFGDVDTARGYAAECDSRYGLIAAPEQLLLGDLAVRSGDLDAAVKWYERARETAPTYGATHVKVAEVYLDQERTSDYAEAMKAYIRVTDEPVWEHVEWMTAREVGSEVVPDAVWEEFQRICAAEFGG